MNSSLTPSRTARNDQRPDDIAKATKDEPVIRTEQEVQGTLAHFITVCGTRITQPRSQEIVNTLQVWLELNPEERVAWLKARFEVATSYETFGDQNKHDEMSNFRLITGYLLGLWNWTP